MPTRPIRYLTRRSGPALFAGGATVAAVAAVVVLTGPGASVPAAARSPAPTGFSAPPFPTRAASNAPTGRDAQAVASHSRHHASVPRVSGYGDSVMLGAKPDMLHTFHGGRVDAVESRQAEPTLADVERDARAGRLKRLVVIHTGTNGTIEPRDLKRALRDVEAEPSVRRILVLTDHVDQPWEEPNNRIIRRVVPTFAKARVVRWNRVASHHPNWLYSDGVHLTPRGQAGYTHMIRHAYLADRG